MSTAQAPEDLCVFLIRQRAGASDRVAGCMRAWQDSLPSGGVPVHELLFKRGVISSESLSTLLGAHNLHLQVCPGCGKGRVVPPAQEERCSRCDAAYERVELAGSVPAQVSRYRVGRLLGRGAMGEVHLATDPSLGREVALKILHFDPDEHPEHWQRFQREGKLVASIRHPNVVRVLTLDLAARPPYLVMEYIDGENFEDYLCRDFDREEGLEILLQSIKGTAGLHESGIIHRDLKPANILLDKHRTPRVTDFGFARLIDQSTQLTYRGQAVGTPFYMAPEQIDGFQEITPAADVYALGVMLYRVLVGRVPFDASNMTELFDQMTEVGVRSPREARPDVSDALDAICLRATRREPAQRYPDAEAMWQDLSAALANPQIAPDELPSGGSVALGPMVGGHDVVRYTWIATGAVILALLLLAIASYFLLR